MLNFKQFIIYTLLISFVMNLAAPVRLAYGDDPTFIPNKVAMERAVYNILREPTEFYMPSEERAHLEEFFNKPPVPQTNKTWVEQTLELNGKEATLNAVQSFVTSLVLIEMGQAIQRAHDQNLRFQNGVQRRLETQLGNVWSQPKILALRLTEQIGIGLMWAILAKKLVKYPAFNKYTASLAAGGVLTIGEQYIQRMYMFAAQVVLEHPEHFGGLSPDERDSLRFLITTIPTTGLFFINQAIVNPGIPFIDNSGKSAVLTHEVVLKIFGALWVILLKAPDLSSALLSHLLTRATLTGKNAEVALAILVRDFAAAKLVPKDATSYKKVVTGIEIGVVVGFIGSLIPTVWEDETTAFANSSYADLQRLFNKGVIYVDYMKKNLSASDDQARQSIIGFLNHEIDSRQSRFVKYAYLIEMAINRVDSLALERKLMDTMTGPGDAKTFGEWISKTFNLVLGGDFLPYSYRAWWNQSRQNSYHDVFIKAVTEMAKMYTDEIATFEWFKSAPRLPADVRLRIEDEELKMRQLEALSRYLLTTLNTRWTDPLQDNNYENALRLVRTTAFWGVHEGDLLQALRNGQFH